MLVGVSTDIAHAQSIHCYCGEIDCSIDNHLATCCKLIETSD